MNKTKFSNLVKKTRKAAGLTQFELAVKLQVSLMTINRWESAESMPRPDSLDHWLKKITSIPPKQKGK